MLYTPQQIENAYNTLPENLSRAITLNNTEKKLEEIGKKFDIHVDKTGELDVEITYVLIGLARSDDFYEKMKGILGVADDKAKEIFKDINEKIFATVRARYQEREKIDAEAKEANEMAEKDKEREAEKGETSQESSFGASADAFRSRSSLSTAEERLMKPFKMTRAETDYSLKTVSAGGVGTTQTPAEKPNDSRPAPADDIQRHSKVANDPYLAKIDEEDLKKK